MADKQKRSLEFRMSKKVAELTQVVHMLFTRNHEKEVEIDALKDAYENEITDVIEDARGRIMKLDNRVIELERKLERERNRKQEVVEKAIVQETVDREHEWKQKLAIAEKALNDEKQETQHLRDLLINAQKDIEKLRQRVEEQLNTRNDEIGRREAELGKLRKQVNDLERTMQAKELRANETIKNYEKNIERLETECLEMQGLLEETYKVKENLTARVKQLEAELRSLKRDFQKKVTSVVQQNHVVKVPRSAPVQQNHSEYNDELERLRAEVRRYRLELQNRDHNFNRMFTEQPMVVDNRAGMIAGAPASRQSTPHSFTQVTSLSIQGRERSFSYDISHGGYEETKRPSSSVSNSSAKLPTLSSEQRARLNKLIKPRPLPKEMLYSK